MLLSQALWKQCVSFWRISSSAAAKSHTHWHKNTSWDGKSNASDSHAISVCKLMNTSAFQIGFVCLHCNLYLSLVSYVDPRHSFFFTLSLLLRRSFTSIVVCIISKQSIQRDPCQSLYWTLFNEFVWCIPLACFFFLPFFFFCEYEHLSHWIAIPFYVAPIQKQQGSYLQNSTESR